MKEKKVSVKSKVKTFVKNHGGDMAVCIGCSVIGSVCMIGVYKIGLSDGCNRTLNAICNASITGNDLIITNNAHESYLFKATKVLKN